MGRLPLAFAFALTCILTGCPEKVDDIGGAPKRQIDHTKESLEKATQSVEDRLKRAEDAAEK